MQWPRTLHLPSLSAMRSKTITKIPERTRDGRRGAAAACVCDVLSPDASSSLRAGLCEPNRCKFTRLAADGRLRCK